MSDYLKQRMEFINAGRPLPQKKTYQIPKVSEKRKKKLAEQGVKGDSALDVWFEERRREMTGKCFLCGGKTEKHNDETYRRSLHHLFDKRPAMFPSVATNVHNCLELCFYGNSCHTNIHNGTITWQLLMDSKEGDMILEKVKKIYPHISQSEMKNFPEILNKYLDL